MSNLYIVYDTEGLSVSPAYGVYTSQEKAEEVRIQLTRRMTNDCFAFPREESGLDPELDYKDVYKEIYESLGIQVVELDKSPID